jgi:hypothetical protein
LTFTTGRTLQHHVAARALRQPERRLLSDHFVLVRAQTFDVGIGHGDHLHWHLGLIEEQTADILVEGGILAGLLAAVRRNLRRRHRGHHTCLDTEQIGQIHLLGRWRRNAPLALLSEQLATQPVELMLQLSILAAQAFVGIAQALDIPTQNRVRRKQFGDAIRALRLCG